MTQPFSLIGGRKTVPYCSFRKLDRTSSLWAADARLLLTEPQVHDPSNADPHFESETTAQPAKIKRSPLK